MLEEGKAETRVQGDQLFALVFALLLVYDDETVVLDFAGVTTVTLDFLTGLAALVGPFTRAELQQRLRLVDLHARDQRILDRLMALRCYLETRKGDPDDF